MNKRDIPWAFLVALVLALVLGYAAGRTVTLLMLQDAPAVERPDVRDLIPTPAVQDR